jgi:hypothetical protein
LTPPYLAALAAPVTKPHSFNRDLTLFIVAPRLTAKGGIGNTENAFTVLGKQITAFESQHNQNLINTLQPLTPIPYATLSSQIGDDIFRQFLVFLKLPASQSTIPQHSDQYTNAMLQLLVQIRADSSQITSYIQGDMAAQRRDQKSPRLALNTP